jgi:threonine/homoserine/homoserine lactone efflux protein
LNRSGASTWLIEELVGMSFEFFLTTLIVVASPGTGAIYTIAAGLGRGAKASVWAALGCTLGIVPHMIAAITGLATILHTSAIAFEIIKYLGVAYLLYMAWMTLKETGALRVDSSPDEKSVGAVIVEAILLNILNPKLSIFFFAFLPQFVPADSPDALRRMLELSGVFMLLTFAVFAAYGFFAAAMRSHVVSRPNVLKWMRRSFAATFVALGARLALTER